MEPASQCTLQVRSRTPQRPACDCHEHVRPSWRLLATPPSATARVETGSAWPPVSRFFFSFDRWYFKAPCYHFLEPSQPPPLAHSPTDFIPLHQLFRPWSFHSTIWGSRLQFKPGLAASRRRGIPTGLESAFKTNQKSCVRDCEKWVMFRVSAKRSSSSNVFFSDQASLLLLFSSLDGLATDPTPPALRGRQRCHSGHPTRGSSPRRSRDWAALRA